MSSWRSRAVRKLPPADADSFECKGGLEAPFF